MSSRKALLLALCLSFVLKCSAFCIARGCLTSVPFTTTRRFPSISNTKTCSYSYTRLKAAVGGDVSDEVIQIDPTVDESEDTTAAEEARILVEDGMEEGFVRSLLSRFGGQKFSQASFAELGFSVVLCYGFVSNVFGNTCVSVAWFLASRRTGLSPLAPGQWKGFMAVYAAFFAFLNIIRPARFALSVYLSKYFDRALNGVQNRFNCSKAIAAGLILTCNICFNFASLGLGVATASTLAGVPVWKKA